HRRAAPPCARARVVGLHLRGRLLRRGRQARVPESHSRARLAESRVRLRVSRLFKNTQAVIEATPSGKPIPFSPSSFLLIPWELRPSRPFLLLCQQSPFLCSWFLSRQQRAWFPCCHR